MSDVQWESSGEKKSKKRKPRLKKRFLVRKKMQRPPEPSPFGEGKADQNAEPDLQREPEPDPFKNGA
jgi:hypothetical protein